MGSSPSVECRLGPGWGYCPPAWRWERAPSNEFGPLHTQTAEIAGQSRATNRSAVTPAPGTHARRSTGSKNQFQAYGTGPTK